MEWRTTMIAKRSMVPIITSVTSNPRVFNGYGQQEGSDFLYAAMIHPAMPTHLVCNSQNVWDRFHHHVIHYQLDRLMLLDPPRTSSPGPSAEQRSGPRRACRTTQPSEPSQPCPTASLVPVQGKRRPGHVWTHVSGVRAFYMDRDAHKRFLANVYVYRRKSVRLHTELFKKYEAAGLFNPSAVIQDDGTAIGVSNLPAECLIFTHIVTGC